MNTPEILKQLQRAGHDARLTADCSVLSVAFNAGGQRLQLSHEFPDEIWQLPAFALVDAHKLEPLAHVVFNPQTHVGFVCVQEADSVSVNYEVPALAYVASVDRHIQLLRRAIEEPDWNRAELLREFHPNWELLCDRSDPGSLALFLACDDDTAGLQVKKPDGRSSIGICGNYFALPQQQAASKRFEAVRARAAWERRQTIGKAVVLRLLAVGPAPSHPDALADWYCDVLAHLDATSEEALKRFARHAGKDFWLVFSTLVSSGTTWFAIRLRRGKKAKLPLTPLDCANWKLTPHSVRSLTRETLVPRGGGDLNLANKSVLLVGCGSVGGELAGRLTSAGIGRLTLTDPEAFDEANLYRHTLQIDTVGYPKSAALAADLQSRHPWATIEVETKNLQDLRSAEKLEEYDLVIIAIGSPTVERAFHDYTRAKNIATPCLNTWVEAYGVGGHATLDVPGSQGCLKCAYVDPETLSRGLSSNLNFLAPNQDVTRTHAGCGNQFLPYSSVAAGYTATIAADLALRYLSGAMPTSAMISWKGSAAQALRAGFTLTHRYEHFHNNLEVLPLYNPECDVCGR